MSSYSELLKDPRWQKKRLQIFERDNWKCTECPSTHLTLHVHHKRYIKGNKPWDYDDELLCTLCEKCHALEEDLKSYDLFYQHAQSVNLTTIRMWTWVGALTYLKLNKPEVFKQAAELLNGNTFHLPPGEEKQKFLNHLVDPLGSDNGE